MTYTPTQLAASKTIQQAAAHDPKPQLRLLAGPGTGKSYSIGERVAWLIRGGVAPSSIWAISFTNAATNDLRDGILKYCGVVAGADQIRITTLHSLALTVLAKGGKLNYYPVRPRVLDEWEQRNVFDEELARALGTGITRCGELRAFFEAKWSTGAPPQPFISSPTRPITAADEAAFQAFYNRVTQTYSCLLPGEAVRKCIDEIKAGTLDPIALTGMAHIIVDEYQDLNLADVEFIDLLIGKGVVAFTCGDDDQSIYSFRHAYPAGIQSFVTRHASAGSHSLETCFRCATTVLKVANNLITAFPPSGRLPKNLSSAYDSSAPPVPGQVVAWQFLSPSAEATAIAQSISGLIAAGMAPEQILVLVGSRGAQLDPLLEAFDSAGVIADVQKDVELSKSDGVRFVYAVLRYLHDADDYLALRTLLGLRQGVGIGRCDAIARSCAAVGLNYSDQFTASRTTSAFSKPELSALDSVTAVLAAIQGWSDQDDLGSRAVELDSLAKSHLAPSSFAEWTKFVALFPPGITLAEFTEVLGARTQRETRERLTDALNRLGIPVPPGLDPSGRIRVMTLHSCKGLSAQAVFIPGLEEEIIPGPFRARFASQVEEAARLLYVGVTRARALCVLSFSRARVMNGRTQKHNASRFLPSLGVTFQTSAGLTGVEIADALKHIHDL